MRFHKSVLHGIRCPDGSVKRARFMGVLRNQNRPSILIEGGYLSNRKEAQKIDSPEYRQKLAESIAGALPQK
jgi:N-acetylmuramoyl-L-alanine amidase